MKRPCPHRRLAPLIPVLVAGCAAPGSFPSLAPRPIERALAAERAAAPPAAATAPKLVEQVAAHLVEARAGQAAFAAALPAANAGVARAGAPASEGWIAAQQAVSQLEAARAPTVAALAELDRLAVVRADTADLPAIAPALAETRALADAQEREIAALQARISPL